MGKVLITGGAGYIGSQTNYLLLEEGYETVVFDRRVGEERAIVPEQSIAVRGDLLHKEEIERVFDEHQIEAVIHFAAHLQVEESVKDPLKYYENNVGGSLNLLMAMERAGVKNIVFSSTAAVYGIADKCPIDEEATIAPINPYGESKAIVETILRDFHRSHNISAICLRYFNACGADLKGRTGENHDFVTHLIPLVIEAAQGKRILNVFGDDYNTPDGTAVRDYVHTMDLASAHLAALRKMKESPQPLYESINVGTGKGYSVMEVIKAVEKVSGKKVAYKIAPRRAGDPETLYALNTKAQEILNWQPQYSDIDTIVSSAWNWAVAKSR